MFLEAGGGIVPGGWVGEAVRGPGLGFGAELGNVCHLHAKWLREEVSRGSFLSASVLVLPAFLPHLLHATRLSAEVSALLLEPPVPMSFSSPGPPALYSSSGLLPPVLPGCFPGDDELRFAWLFAVSGVLCQATFLITPFLLLFCTLGTFHE